MEKLLELAKQAADQAELYIVDNAGSGVSFDNAELHDIDSSFQSGISLRIIKDGKLGFAYTKNLVSREELVQNALDSLKGQVEADYEFPLTENLPELNTYDPEIEKITGSMLVDECSRLCEIFRSKTNAEINVGAGFGTSSIRIMNTKGTDISRKSTSFDIGAGLIIPGGATSISRGHSAKKFELIPEDVLEELLRHYNAGEKKVSPKGGRMKVLFMPNSFYTLGWRITSGTNGRNVYDKISPVDSKIGEKIFSEKLTISDNPLNDLYPGARSFDDEGVACTKFPIIENGVLKNFYYDLKYAKKMNATPTGHGFRSSMWGGDSTTMKPAPALNYLSIEPGDKSLEEMIASIDRGIILEGVMGAHSGNIPNGDYSVGVSPALYVENGEIVGLVQDAMVAGSIYDTLNNIVALENKVHDTWGGYVPAILCDDVSVSVK